jgi:hypothetical protein
LGVLLSLKTFLSGLKRILEGHFFRVFLKRR